MLTAIRHSLVASLFRAGTVVFSLFAGHADVRRCTFAVPERFLRDASQSDREFQERMLNL
jgi:hypothetical protein